jgi:hypothetical protein
LQAAKFGDRRIVPVRAGPHHAIDADPAVSTIAAAPASAKKTFEPFSSVADTIVKGMKLPEYGTELPRTFALVVAPCSTAAPASAVVWEFHGSGQSQHCPAARASRHLGRPATEATGLANAGTIEIESNNVGLSGIPVPAMPVLAGDCRGQPCNAASAPVDGKAGRTPAISGLIGTRSQGGVRLS